jgi:hypothetical protein
MNVANLLFVMQSARVVPEPVSPTVRTEIIEAATITNNHGDAIVTADDLAPATCDSGTGFYMVVSVWRARQLEQLNPGLVCEFGVERYGVTG